MDRDRSKRRRRRRPKSTGASQELAPLQPAYPEAEGEQPEISQPEEAVDEPQPQSPVESSPQQRGRKRRRRGSRPEPRRAQARPTENAKPQVADAGPAAEESREPVAEQPQPPVAKAMAKRPPKGTVVLAIGLPGSGKTSWFRRRGITPLSSDLLRMLLFDDITEQRYQDLTFSTLRYLLRARLIARMPWNYVDATNLSPRERRGWIKMAHEFGFEVHAVFFDVPADVCQDRNQRRGRVVPDDVMQRMAGKLRAPTFEEGFSKIIVVRVKQRSEAEPAAPEPYSEQAAEQETGTTQEEEQPY